MRKKNSAGALLAALLFMAVGVPTGEAADGSFRSRTDRLSCAKQTRANRTGQGLCDGVEEPLVYVVSFGAAGQVIL